MARNRANTHVETITSQEVGSIDDVLGSNLGGDQETKENPVAGSEDNLPAADEPVEIQKETADSASEADEPDAEETNSGQDADEEPEETVEKPILENLSVLAHRHRIPAWQQAALLRYMGWQDDKMVSNEDYMTAMQALKTRRIGGGRK